MTGLERIIEHIKLENTKVCDSIISKAQAEAEQIISEEALSCDIICKDIIDKANREACSLVDRGKSSDALNMRKSILLEKQNLVSACLEKALELMKNLDDTMYFDAFASLVVKYAYPQSGVLVMSAKDKTRMPEGFIDKLNQKLEPLGAAIELSPDCRDFNGGFVLQYGEIEENCVFENLFAAYSDKLRDVAGSILFKV